MPKNGNAAASIPQAKTPGEFAIPNSDCHQSCLAIYDRSTKGVVAKVPLSEREFIKLVDAKFNPQFKGMFPEDIAAVAIREKLARPEEDGLTELETTHFKVRALLQLLSDKFDHMAHDGNAFEGPAADDLSCGISILVREAQTSLTNSFHTVFDAAHPTRGEAAS